MMATEASKPRLAFFLGGNDLEMETIRDVLRLTDPERIRVHDRRLGWGARASDYGREEFVACGEEGLQLVLVELPDDLGLETLGPIVVDHHGESAGSTEATSLEQVFMLLQLPRTAWTRWHDLVAANDRAHIPGLVAIGATPEEIGHVRAADRAAQGITPDHEHQSIAALARAERRLGGRLTVVRQPHSRMASIEDRLHEALGGPGVENLLVFSPGEANFSGAGGAVEALRAAFPDSWWGGDLPRRGYWGAKDQVEDAVLAAVEAVLREV